MIGQVNNKDSRLVYFIAKAGVCQKAYILRGASLSQSWFKAGDDDNRSLLLVRAKTIYA
ncbi:hypothetical protein [Nitrososphaera sp. AFS]|uniref:hypothetical protein n=1 Tax=Nitrososphaera sp. AFS TaxID=2301191 RepID=UPI00139228D3|nr:hypothetical protein [Nitrososphaera sp. AFS]